MLGGRVGACVGVAVGPRGSLEWSLDATSGKAMPATPEEMAALLAAAGVPGNVSAMYLFNEPSGSIVDQAGSRDLTASGTLTYQQNVTGWSTKGIKTTRAVTGWMENTTFGDVASTAATIYLWAGINAVNSGVITRTLYRYGTTYNDDACMELRVTNTTEARLRVGEGDTTRTDGTELIGNTVRLFALVSDTTITGYHDLEKVIGGTRAANGTRITFGGDNVGTFFPGDVQYMRAVVVDAAHSAAQVKAVMQTAGWTVPWS